jgi:L-ascorbate metabolism protein UlaG (beta-lactamase superfamily)
MPGRRKILTLLISAALAWPVLTQSEPDVVQLKYLGTAGWEITDGRTVILVDPYLSRLRRVTPNDTVDPADNRPLFDNAAIARSDTAIIDAHVTRADFVLITHTHYDHALDAPYIASKTRATIIGTESTYHFARAQGVPADKLIVVRGGEDYAFEGFSVRVIPSLHGVLRQAPNRRPDPNASLPPAVFPRDAKPPFRMGDLLIEGGTLAYLIRLGGRQILAFGSMNYIEREIEGLRPDVALIGAMPERREIYQYTSRLLRALGNPRMVLPTHWDRFNVTYDVAQDAALQRLQTFIAEVKDASPHTKVVVPKYFEPVSIQ